MKLLITLTLLLTLHCASAMEQLIGMGPELQGAWISTAYSEDKGKTIHHNAPVAVARVTATRIIMSGGEENRVVAVYAFPAKEGEGEYYLVELVTGIWMTISKVVNTKYYMVIVSPGLEAEEAGRYLIYIE